MITLTPMPDDAFRNWMPKLWADYRAELIRSGESEAAADANVAQSQAATLIDGVLAPGNHVFQVLNQGRPIGVVWIVQRGAEWFIYDVEIEPAFQGRGFGRAAMQEMETFVREQGGSKIGLSVFGFNEVAKRLYASLGYETTRLSMSKVL